MGFPILVRWHLYIESGPWSVPSYYLNQCWNIVNLTLRNKILIKIHTFSFKKMHLKMSSVKWRPFCVSLNVMLMWCHWNGVIRVCLVSSKSVWYETYILVVFHAILQFSGHLYNYNGVKIKYGTTKLKLSLMVISLTTSFTLMNKLLLEANALSNRWQTITWTNADLAYWCIYA